MAFSLIFEICNCYCDIKRKSKERWEGKREKKFGERKRALGGKNEIEIMWAWVLDRSSIWAWNLKFLGFLGR